MHDLLADVRYACRTLLRNPGFAAIAIAALALGIGANTAIFSAVDAVLLRPLPYLEADRLAMVWEDSSHVGFPRNTPAPANYFDWKKQNTVFSDMAALRFTSVNITGDGAPEMVTSRLVTPNFFSVLGVKPMLGRVMTVEEDRAAAPVAVLTYALWKRRYAGESIIGRTIHLNGQPFTVIGVMPRGFHFPERETQLFTPFGLERQATVRGSHFLNVVARLKPGVSTKQAQTEMQMIAKRLEAAYPGTNAKVGAVVVPLREQITGDTRTALLVLLAAAACVLLIACSNLANLLLAKATGRQREIAVRSALGAGRGRIVRQMLTESAVLALFGGVFGVALGYGGTGLLEKLVPMGMVSNLTVDGRVLLVSILVSAATALIFGLIPALKAARVDVNDALKQGSRGNTGGRSRWVRNGLVVSEVALAIVLLVGAGLMIQTLHNMRSADTGFRTDRLLTMRLLLPPAKYPDPEKRAAFFEAALHHVRSLPGVRSAAFTGNLPFTTSGNTVGYAIGGRPDPSPGDAQDALYRPVTRDYFDTIGARLKQGRFFTNEDHAKSPLVAIINEHFARLHWGEKSPLGDRVVVGPLRLTIVGVIRDMRERGFEFAQKPAMYILMEQGISGAGAYLAVRTDHEPETLVKAVTQALWSVDKDQPVSQVRTMNEIIEVQMENRDIQMTLLTIFATLALALASIGIYGVLSYLVTQRVREIGVRMALGATTQQVTRMVVGHGLALTAVGLLLGLIASAVAARWMGAMLYQVQPLDVRVYLSVAVLLAVIATLACCIPAYRAARVDPMIALRDE